MKIHSTAIAGVKVVQLQPMDDSRGSFARVYCEAELDACLEGRRILQVNQSLTHRRGSIRGLHYQLPPAAEMKFVRCIRGAVFDVAVDLRAGSGTFLQHHSELLTGDNWKMLVIPEGCAHGFQTLEPDSELMYFHTHSYTPELEGGVAYDDAGLAIDWPLPPADISPRDSSLGALDEAFEGIDVGGKQ